MEYLDKIANILSILMSGVALLVTALIATRKLPIEKRTAEAQNDKTQSEIIASYEETLVKAIKRAQLAEERFQVTTTAFRTQIDSLQARIDVCETFTTAYIRVMREWQYGYERLIAQLVSAGMTPVWRPGELPDELKVLLKKDGD